MSRLLRRFAGLAAALLLVIVRGILPVIPVQAHAAIHLRAVRSLALPKSLFGASAHVVGHLSSNAQADTFSGLHGTPLSALGRISGFEQTATWTSLNAQRHMQTVTIRYLASVFTSEDAAGVAFSDARAALWAMGHPVHIAGITDPTFAVDERDGHADLVVLYLNRIVEDEFILRSSPRSDTIALQNAGWYFQRAIRSAHQRARRLTASLPLQPASPAPPDIAVAPWGTGPVVESPSLLVLDTGQLPATAHPGPAVVAGLPTRLSQRARYHPALLPPGPLSAYARTSSFGGGSLDNVAALYSNSEQAALALHDLIRANRHAWMTSMPVNLTTLPGADGAAEWHLSQETVLAVRTQNVVMTLASTRRPPYELNLLAARALLGVPTYLHAQGTEVVDANAHPVHFAGLNWYGAEENDFVVGGLGYRSYQSLLQQVRALGYNTIRLPFSNQLVEQNPVVTDHVDASPELSGLHALDILDRIINYAGALGLHVILDDHRSDAGWSSQGTGLWYTPQYPESSFLADWVTMARRYAVNNVVIGADLRNEPHASASWGTGNPATDWRLAAQQAGDAVLAVNPNLLVIVEGVQYFGSSPSYWWGGNLMGVAGAPVLLQFPSGTSARSQLVYSAHDYGPDNCGTGCPWFNPATTYDSLRATWEQYWGYITDDPTQPYAAPVWVGEFGTCDYQITCGIDTVPGSQGQWFSSLIHYLGTKNLSWAYWSLNGAESTGGQRVYGSLDWYGLLNNGWGDPFPWLNQLLQSIQSPSANQVSDNTTPPEP